MDDHAEPPEPSNEPFVPVCAIGASAGGVTALQGLFRQLPGNLGLAYVVVLHLSPDQPSALSDILSGCTRMPVLQVQDGPTLKPDCVYVIPPDRELVIQGDSVAARPFSEPRGRRAPIDMFFRSIAAARGDGVAIVLSGAGADGALGVLAVKEAGGVIMVQEPAEAAFPSMPQNAIASGVADFVAPLARLAERLAEVARSKEAVRSLDMDGSANDLRRIVAFLRARTGHDFSSYKRATVMRRVIRRMQVCRTDTIAAYADYLAATPEEAKELFSDLLISVTMFFRDPRAFEALGRHAIKPIFDGLDLGKEESIRAWVVGCSTGEEAYSLAMLLHEEASRRKTHVQFQIFASDLDEGALATAREGRYPRSIEADVSDERLARFFIDEGTHYRVRKELRESVLFATHSVLKEPPFMRLDLITCRNLLIYMERALQQQICSIFHYGLKPGRFLFLGSAETADSAADLFAPLDREARIYGSRPQAAHALPILPQFSAPERLNGLDQPFLGRNERADLPVSLHVSALERTAPASALVDGAHNVVHLSPSAGRFILHSGGPVSSQLPAIVRPELRLDLRLALARALDGKEPTLTHPALVALDGERRRISMHVAPVPNDMHMGAQALVFFIDGGAVPDEVAADVPPDPRPDEVRRLHAELKAAQEAVVASRAGHEASIQDLRATNEELQSINEEYRSTAEELETSKEELQSINEELHTVNAELKSKLASISVAHSDLQNLTDATEIGTLFLDGDLRIKMFTPPIADLFNITKADYGRTITDFSHRLDYDRIDDDARQVLKQLAPVERIARSREARSFVMRMRPYRTIEDRIEGVVLTFFDITERLDAQAALRKSEEKYRTVFDSIDEGFCVVEVILDDEGRPADLLHLEANKAYERHTGLRDIVGKRAREIVPDAGPWLGFYGKVALTGEAARNESYLARPIDRWIAAYASRVGGDDSLKVAVVFNDITERKRAEQVLRESEERQAFLLKLSDTLRAETGVEAVGNRAVKIIAEKLGVDRVYLVTLTPGDDTVVVTHETRREDLAPLEGSYRGSDFPNAIKEIFDRTIVYDDVRTDARLTDLDRMSFGGLDAAGFMAASIRRGTEAMIWAAGVVSTRPRSWTATEIALFEEAAGQTWAAVERARAEEELRESEMRFRTLADTAPAFIWFNDEVGANVFVNQAFLDYTGRSAEQVTGDRWHGLIHPDQAVAYVASYLEAVRMQTSWRGRNLLRRADGIWHWCDNYARPLFRADGSYRGHVGVLIDVDDKVRAEEALSESEERQAFLLKLTDMLRPLVDARDIKAAAAAVVSEWLDIASAGYAEVETGGLIAVITDEFNDGRIPSLTARYTLADFSSVTDPMRRGETIHFADLDDDGVSPETRIAFSAINVRAAVATPLIKNGVMVAYLFVAHPEPRVWTTADLDVLKEVAERTWAAVERARAETALQASEALRRVALEGGGMGTWRWDLGSRLIWGDAKFMALWGFPPSDEPQPLSLFTERMSPEGAREMEVIVTRAIAADEEFDGPLEIVAGPTAGRWIRWRGQANKGAPSTLYGVTFDITEQREAESALRESEQRFVQFASSSSDGLWIRNAATLAMEYVSPAIETIYGVRSDAFLGDMKRWASLIVPDDRDVAFKHIEAARAGEAVVHEFRIQRPSDGAFRWIRNTDFPLFDAHGGVERIGGIAEDVTEQKLAAEHQGVLLAELQHRVRNIMAMIRSVTARTGERAASVEDYASLMMGRLLALARVQALLTRAANANVGIASIVRDEVGAQAQQEGQYLLEGPDVSLSPKAAEVLTLAVHELATNALKYGALSVPNGKVTVRWSTIEKGGTPWLSFDWTEEGAPVRQAPSPDAPRRRGFGSELIEGRVPYELRGSGEVTIEPGGAKCHLEFPLSPGASILETGAPQRATVFGGALDMTGEPDLSGHRILVVEDDYYLATDTARALQGAGAEIVGPCGTQEDARAELDAKRPDAVILDINLGAGASFKLASHLKVKGIPFVFTTGYDQEVIPAEFKAIERLEKPFQLRQVVGVAARLVGKPV